MFEEIPRPGPLAVGAVAVAVAAVVLSGTVRAWVAAVAGPLVSLGIVVGVALWLGDKA